MSVKTLAGELEQEYYHLMNRLTERVESLGLDPNSDEVRGEIEYWFGGGIAYEMADGA